MADSLKLKKCLRGVDGGVVLALLVQPRASRNEVVGLQGERLKVRIRSAPVHGKANKELSRFLGRLAGVSASRVAVLSGDTGRRKKVHIEGATAAALTAVLTDLIE